MTLFISILIFTLFSTGIVILFKLNSIRLSISSQVNTPSIDSALIEGNSNKITNAISEIKTEKTLLNELLNKKVDEQISTLRLLFSKEKNISSSLSLPIFKENSTNPNKEKHDEIEELRRRAIKRIEDLRDLSFVLNETDFTNNFENIPAYLRRNIEIDTSSPKLEDFYGKYYINFQNEDCKELFIKKDDIESLSNEKAINNKSDL